MCVGQWNSNQAMVIVITSSHVTNFKCFPSFDGVICTRHVYTHILWKSHWQHSAVAISICCGPVWNPLEKHQWRCLLSLVCGEAQQERWLFWCSSEVQWGVRWIEGTVVSWVSAVRSMCLCLAILTQCVAQTSCIMLAKGVEITLAAYFNNLLLMLSGPGARPLLRHPSACVTSSTVTGWLSGRGLPMNGSSHSSDWSEYCLANHSRMASPWPWSIPIHLPSWVWIVSGGGRLVDLMAWTALNILWLSSVKAISLASWSALWQATSRRRWLICLNMRLRSSLWRLALLHASWRNRSCLCCCDKSATRWSRQ